MMGIGLTFPLTVVLIFFVFYTGNVKARHIPIGTSWRKGPSPLGNGLEWKRTELPGYRNQVTRLDLQRNTQLLRRTNVYPRRQWPDTSSFLGNEQQYLRSHDNRYGVVSNIANNDIRSKIVNRKTNANSIYNVEQTKVNRHTFVDYHQNDYKRMRSGHVYGNKVIPPSIKPTRHSHHSIHINHRARLIKPPGRNIRITLRINNGRRGTRLTYRRNNRGYRTRVSINAGNQGMVQSRRFRGVSARDRTQTPGEMKAKYPLSLGISGGYISSTNAIDRKVPDATVIAENTIISQLNSDGNRQSVQSVPDKIPVLRDGATTSDIYSYNTSTQYEQHAQNSNIVNQIPIKTGIKLRQTQRLNSNFKVDSMKLSAAIRLTEASSSNKSPERIKGTSRILPNVSDKYSKPSEIVRVLSKKVAPTSVIYTRHSDKVSPLSDSLQTRSGNVSSSVDTNTKHSGTASSPSDTHPRKSGNVSPSTVTTTTEEADVPDNQGITEAPDSADIPEIS